MGQSLSRVFQQNRPATVSSVNTEQRANQIWKQLLSEYQQPPIDEALQDYVARRKLKINKPS
ncbi:MAG: hypothetical protein GY770_22285 [Aestuariibacter sp.]|nr:hypothetical protein [Aestuariibacter sp.]MCP4925113.1 hypothetical protein [Gammaproteobacteria bacterium]